MNKQTVYYAALDLQRRELASDWHTEIQTAEDAARAGATTNNRPFALVTLTRVYQTVTEVREEPWSPPLGEVAR